MRGLPWHRAMTGDDLLGAEVGEGEFEADRRMQWTLVSPIKAHLGPDRRQKFPGGKNGKSRVVTPATSHPTVHPAFWSWHWTGDSV